MGAGLPGVGDRRGDRPREAAPARLRAGRHLDHRAGSRSTTSARSAERHGVPLYTDATASLGGNPFEADAWGLDAATAGLQKCLGGPSGHRSDHLSPRAVERIRAHRKRRGRHPRGGRCRDAADFVRSNDSDLGMILDYWGPRRLNHHTEATSMLYARARARPRAAPRGAGCRDRAASAARGGDARGCRAGSGSPVFGDVAQQGRTSSRSRSPKECRGMPRGATCCRTSGSRSARPSGPCTARSGASARWAITPARTPCCTTLAALETVLRRYGAVASRLGRQASRRRRDVYAAAADRTRDG